MAQRYLYPYRKRLEVLSATYAGGFGANLLHITGRGEPLAWAGLDNADALALALLICGAALVHGLGVWINGGWSRYGLPLCAVSPALRFAGMSAHAILFGALAWHGTGTTGGYTYGAIAMLMLYGAKSAGVDVVRAVKEAAGQWKAI